MEESFIRHLPVVEERELKGILSSEAILAAPDTQVSVGQLSLIRPDGHFVFAEQHLYDAIRMMVYTGHAVVPVLDSDGFYLGAIDREEALKAVANFTGLNEPGGILVLAINPGEYHLREIASVVESNDAQILSLYVAPSGNELEQYVVLKLNISELSAVQAGFERYGYRIAYAFYDQKQLDDSRDRYALLMNYLQI